MTRTQNSLIRLFATATVVTIVAAGATGQWKHQSNQVTRYETTTSMSVGPQEKNGKTEWTSRRITAVILSSLIPGSGQSYLGHTTKGAAFTLSTFGCGLIALLAQNNVVGRNERIDELTGQYLLAIKYDTAQTFWQKMLETKSILGDDVKRRNAFRAMTAILWMANIVDVVFFTDDKGERTFGAVMLNRSTSLAITTDPYKGIIASMEIRM